MLSAAHRRRIHLIVGAIWLGPGAVVSWFLMNSVPWLVFMSWFAIIYAVAGAYSGETPVETEGRE